MVETIEPGSVKLESDPLVQAALKNKLHPSINPAILDDLRKIEQNFLIGLSHSNFEVYQHAAFNNLDNNSGDRKRTVTSGLGLILGYALGGGSEISQFTLPPVFDAEGKVEPFYDNANEILIKIARQKKFVVYETRLETVETILDTEGVFGIDPAYIKRPDMGKIDEILVNLNETLVSNNIEVLNDKLGYLEALEYLLKNRKELIDAGYRGDLTENLTKMALRTNEIYFKPGALQNAADENVPVLDLLSQCLKIVQQYVPEELDKIINILQQDTEGLVYVNDQIKKGTIYDPYEDGEKHHINFLLDILNISYS